MPNSSNNSTSYHSTTRRDEFAVSIDVDQWRNDIRAFSETTRKMLESVDAELSSGLATGEAQVRVQSNATHHWATATNQPPTAPSQSSSIGPPTQQERSLAAARASAVEDDCDRLLANLRKQLDSQLNQ